MEEDEPVKAGRLRSDRVLAAPATLDQASVVQSCFERSADYFRRAEGRPVGRNDGFDLCADASSDPPHCLFVLLADTAPDAPRAIGVMDLRLDTPSPGEGTIALLLLVPEARRQGLGREIAISALDWLRGTGMHTVQLGVRRGAVGAAEFWSSLGFEEVGSDADVREFSLTL